MSAGLGHINLVEAATLAGGDWETALPITNAATRDLAEVARSSDALEASTQFTIDHGSAKTRRALALKFHNLSSAASITWSLGSTPGGSEVATLTADAWQFTPTSFDGRRNEIILILPAAYSARYDLVEISDTGNADGYVEIGYVYTCNLFVPRYGLERAGTSSAIVDRSVVERYRSGVPWVDAQRKVRAQTVRFPALVADEGDTMHEIMRVAGVSEPVLYVPDVTDAAASQRYGFVGSIDELTPLENPFFRGQGAAFRLTEW